MTADDVWACLVFALGLLWCVGAVLIDADYDQKMQELRRVDERVRRALRRDR